MSIPLLSINYFDTQKYVAAGAVFGKRIEAISLFRGIAAGIQGLFGGQIGMVEKKIQDGTEGAKADLLKQALATYPQARAIVGLQIHITDVGRDDQNQFILTTAQGTVIIPKGNSSVMRGGKGSTRKERRSRKTTRKNGGALPTDYPNCDHIYEEDHTFPSMLISLKKKKTNKKATPGPKQPRRFYDCEEIFDENGNSTDTFQGRSCENSRFNDMILKRKDIEEIRYAETELEIADWCCPDTK